MRMINLKFTVNQASCSQDRRERSCSRCWSQLSLYNTGLSIYASQPCTPERTVFIIRWYAAAVFLSRRALQYIDKVHLASQRLRLPLLAQ